MTRILIIEGDRHVHDLLRLQVEHLGYEVAKENEPFDVALVEPAVPEGFAAARRLRSEDARLPLVFVSIRHASEVTRALSPVAHLVKPFGLRRLSSALAAARETGAVSCA